MSAEKPSMEIEITPEMIRAATRVLGAYNNDDCINSETALEIVEAALLEGGYRPKRQVR
jgi:hypothetical protein